MYRTRETSKRRNIDSCYKISNCSSNLVCPEAVFQELTSHRLGATLKYFSNWHLMHSDKVKKVWQCCLLRANDQSILLLIIKTTEMRQGTRGQHRKSMKQTWKMFTWGILWSGMGNKSKDEWYDNKIKYFYYGKNTMTREIRGEQ